MNLATYMVVVTTFAWLTTIWQQLKIHASALMQSQTAVNKIANCIFSERNNTEVGFAILHRRDRGAAEGANDLILLRYNSSFQEMIDPPTQQSQDRDNLSENIEEQPDDFTKRKEALSNAFLSKFTLREKVDSSND